MKATQKFQFECPATDNWCGCCECPKASFQAEIVVSVENDEVKIEVIPIEKDHYTYIYVSEDGELKTTT